MERIPPNGCSPVFQNRLETALWCVWGTVLCCVVCMYRHPEFDMSSSRNIRRLTATVQLPADRLGQRQKKNRILFFILLFLPFCHVGGRNQMPKKTTLPQKTKEA